MQTKLIQIDPRKAVVDLPIDENNAKDIDRQTHAWGAIITPVEVWIKDRSRRAAVFAGAAPEDNELLIMDGFHRVTVATRLGIETIPALLFDCTDEEFWDKRISDTPLWDKSQRLLGQRMC